jgi:hypothetical protein
MWTSSKIGRSAISVNINVSGLDALKTDIIQAMSPETRKNALKVGAESALIAIKGYYTKTGRSNWLNNSLPTHGPGRKLTDWWKLVESAWTVGNVTSQTATISNSTTGFAHKVTGGVITAKRKKYLTIPVHPTAHGVRARDYANSIAPLFAAKGVLARTEDDGTITPIYALKKSVNQKPWPTALPPEQTYADAFVNSAVDHILSTLQ